MNPFTLRCIPLENSQDLMQKIGIVISNALNAPPHLGISFHGYYSSLSHKGQEINIRLDVFLKKLKSLNYPCVFIEIKPHPVYSLHYLNELFVSCLSHFKKAGTDDATCLSPIKIFIKEAYFINPESYNFIFELVPILKEQLLVDEVYSLFFNLKKSHDLHNYEFPIYNTERIHEYIKLKSTA